MEDICFDERAMVYPPVVLHSFKWVQGMPYKDALSIWVVIIFISSLASCWIWIRNRDYFWGSYIVLGLLMFQFPMGFALERANNDVIVLALGSLAYACFCKNRLFLTGLLLGGATAYKVYPAVTTVVIFLGLTQLNYQKVNLSTLKKSIVKYRGAIFGFIIGTFLPILLFLQDYADWYNNVLPHFMGIKHSPHYTNHNFQINRMPEVGLLVGLLVLFLWIKKIRKFEDEAKLPILFSFALAIGNYFPGTSNDYNLICSIPFILMLVRYSSQIRDKVIFGMMVGAVAILHSFYLFWPPFPNVTKIAMHSLVLLVLPIILERTRFDLIDFDKEKRHA